MTKKNAQQGGADEGADPQAAGDFQDQKGQPENAPGKKGKQG
jgi:hypothetical protein